MKNYQSLSVRIAATVACFLLLQTLSAQWPQWRGPNRDGYCTETNLLKSWPAEGPKLVWSSDTIGEGFSSAIIEDKVVYTTGKRDSSEIMTALDFNGKMIWQTELGKALKADWPESRCTPTFYKNKLYAVTNAGKLTCLDSKTGKLEWESNVLKNMEGVSSFNGFGESPLVIDDKVILSPCGKKTTIIALNYTNGSTIWSSESINDTNNYVNPFVIQNNDKKAIITSTNNYIVAVDAGSGKILWKDKAGLSIVPLPGEKKVYFPSYKGGIMMSVSDDLTSYNYLWNDTLKSSYMGGVVKIGDKAFGTLDRPGKGIYCMDLKTGMVRALNKELNYACLLAADGMIYSYEDQNGRVCLIKPNENSIDIVSSFKVKQGKGPNLAHPVIANGLLFIRHGKYLMAYDVKQI